MVLVLDANEYILAFGGAREPRCERLLNLIHERHPSHRLCISRLIVSEVQANLSPQMFREFILLLNILTMIDEDFLVPFELGAKYEAHGLKSADALIAAYAEWVKADVLVSENRHFLSRQKALPFKVRSAEQSLRLLK